MSSPPDNKIPYYMAVLHPEFLNEAVVDPTADPNMDIVTPGLDLDKSLIQLVNEQVANNPYSAITAFDPSEQLDMLGDATEAFDTKITEADPEEDWTDYTETALGMYDEDIGDLTIEDMTESRYRRALKAMQIETSRFVAGAADINAVHSDAFVRSLGMMEGDLLASLQGDEFRLDFMDKQMKLDYLTKAVMNMTNMQQAQFGGLQNVASMRDAEVRTHVTAQGNYYREESDITINEAKWELENFGEIGAFMGAINGAPKLIGIRQTPLQQFMTNALPTAAMMGSAGAMVGGPIGGAVGLIGGVLGAGLFQAAG